MLFVKIFTLLLVAAAPQLAQSGADPLERSKDLLRQMQRPEMEDYLRQAVRAELPPVSVDALTFLGMNKEAEMLPEMMRLLRTPAGDSAVSAAALEQLGEIVAYIASPASVQALLDLAGENPKLATRLLERSLSSRSARGNPFPLAYQIVETGNDVARQVAYDWVEVNASAGQNYQHWKQFLLSRGGDQKLTADPLVKRVGADALQALSLGMDEEKDARRKSTTGTAEEKAGPQKSLTGAGEKIRK